MPDGFRPAGSVPDEFDLVAVGVEEVDAASGFVVARGVNLVATVRRELGSLDAVRRVVKVLGTVNCAPGFDQTRAVIDGCSDFLVELFGEEIEAMPARRSGWPELPFGIPVEIEMIVEVE